MQVTFYKSFLLFIFTVSFAGFVFAQTEREKGIEFYKQGKNNEAIAALEKASKENKTDAEVWNYLGVAYVKKGDLKRAIKVLEKAVGLSPQNAVYETNLAYAYLVGNKLNKAQSAGAKAIELNPKSADAYYIRGSANLLQGKLDDANKDVDKAVAADKNYSPAYTLKSDVLLYTFGNRIANSSSPSEQLDLLVQSKEILQACLKDCQNNLEAAVQQERLETVETFYKYFSKKKDVDLNIQNAAAAPPDPNKTPLKILSKPSASYTGSAQRENVSGDIKMLVLFSSSGRVTHTLVLKGLGNGLTENAVKAARQMKFEPATENGKPISVIKIVIYSFSIH